MILLGKFAYDFILCDAQAEGLVALFKTTGEEVPRVIKRRKGGVTHGVDKRLGRPEKGYYEDDGEEGSWHPRGDHSVGGEWGYHENDMGYEESKIGQQREYLVREGKVQRRVQRGHATRRSPSPVRVVRRLDAYGNAISRGVHGDSGSASRQKEVGKAPQRVIVRVKREGGQNNPISGIGAAASGKGSKATTIPVVPLAKLHKRDTE